MPNDALLSRIEEVRDTYTQRQKATNGLLAALKGATGALNKASRSLNDYLDQNRNGQLPKLTEAQQAFGALRLKDDVVDPLLPDLRREVKLLTKLGGALKDAHAALRGDSVDVVKLGHAYGVLQSVNVQDDALSALLPEIDGELQQAQRTLGETFGQALRGAVAELELELRGRPPRFELGRFEINANFVSRSASISYGKILVVKRVPLSVEAVIKAYQREAKVIMGRNEDGERWIEQFYLAWQNARRKRERADQRANIVDCYYEQVLLRQSRTFRSAPSKASFVDYSRAQFAYDFFEFINQQRCAYQGQRVSAHTATKSQTESADKSIWIVEGDSPYDGRYIADVAFVKDE
jgi:hypothetical protein